MTVAGVEHCDVPVRNIDFAVRDDQRFCLILRVAPDYLAIIGIPGIEAIGKTVNDAVNQEERDERTGIGFRLISVRGGLSGFAACTGVLDVPGGRPVAST